MKFESLELFIINGAEREVDAWWAEKGMELGVIKWALSYRSPSDGEWTTRCDQIEDEYSSKQPCFPVADHWADNDEWWYGYDIVPHYTTDRSLSHDIEDRMEELGSQFNYMFELGHMTSETDTTGTEDDWALVRATNRERILAAARVMNLSLTNPEGLDDSDKSKGKSSPD